MMPNTLNSLSERNNRRALALRGASLFARQRQHFDRQVQRPSGLCDRQAGAIAAVEQQLQLGIGQMLLDLLQKADDGSGQLRQSRRLQIRVAREPDDERGVLGLIAPDQCLSALPG
jgi:hypothetical protein